METWRHESEGMQTILTQFGAEMKRDDAQVRTNGMLGQKLLI